jgi:peptidoglycan hydrolase-like protein with peptidoglycan-binding domain
MKRALALLTAGLLVGSVSAHSAMAQTTAPAKPSPTTSMQHSQTTGSKVQHDSTAVKSKSSATKQQWSKDQIKEAQAGLAKAGYFKGTQNGVYGRRTRNAVKAYQKANKLPVTGQLSDSLLSRLRSS